jgi:hypothetical protein
MTLISNTLGYTWQSKGRVNDGLIDDTKCQAEERKRNIFLVLFIVNTNRLKEKVAKSARIWITFMMEEIVGFHQDTCLWKNGFMIVAERRR